MIDGVVINTLKTHGDHRGFFREIFRFTEGFKGIPVGQLSHSLVNEGVIKGWHGHVYQSQWNYVVTGLISIALIDNRKDSPTYKKSTNFQVGDGDDHEPKAYFFPPGVFHGYKCLKGPMQIIYVTSGVFDLEDEIRVPLDELHVDLDW
ncbi:dTDP-4-dehydrorhamnose 3,5-epimerase family protein [bacterium]|nr:dTDP-4-dehydrorhamnose 3,5-epimerase family protein [bacterium]